MGNDISDRVRASTDSAINQRIDDEIDQRIRFYAAQPEDVISHRIAELDAEWSIERVIQTNASSLGLAGILLSVTVNKKWLMLTTTVLGFLFLHSIEGWCPPVPALRRLGVRTRGEIEREKYALNFLRGDFVDVNNPEKAKQSVEQLIGAMNA